MPSLNKIFFMGHLTRDVQFKILPSQTAIAEFGLACNRKFKSGQGEEREEVTFVDCAAFGKTAEVINQYFTKGKPIFVEGRLKYDQWEDKNGGGKRSKLSIVVENFQFIGGNDNGGGDDRASNGGDRQQSSRPNGGQRQQYTRSNGGGGGRPAAEPEAETFDDSDIPFFWEGRSSQPL